MNRGRARYSYTPQAPEEGIEDYDEYYTPPAHHHKRRYQEPEAAPHYEEKQCPCARSTGMCPCAAPSVAAAPINQQTVVGSSFDGLDFKQMLLFAGVGILFVVAIDAIVRLAGAHKSSSKTTPALPGGGGAITIDGKTYVPV